MDVLQELQEIGELLGNANLITAIRREVAKVRQEGIVVTDGSHHETGSEWEAVVRTSGDVDKVARRIRSGAEDVVVERITDDLLGVKTARRGA